MLSSVNQRYTYGVNGQLSTTQQWNGTSWVTVSNPNYNSAGNDPNDTMGAGSRVLYDYSSGATFTYDLEGNVSTESMTVPSPAGGGSTTQQVTTFTWDNHGNLLSAVTTLAGTAVSETDYFYDGLNRMIGETVKTFGSNPTTTQYGYIYDGSSQLLTINLTSGDANQGRVIQSNFLGNQPGEILAIDMPGQTTGGQPTPAVWLFTDLPGTPTSFGIVNSQGTWQIQQRVMGTTGLVTSTLGDTSNALNQTPVIWNGAQQQTQLNTPTLYDLNGDWYDPLQNRFETPQAISATSPNPYSLNGNNPINSAGSNLSQFDGPDTYSNSFNRFIGSTVQNVVGNDNLANASDWQLVVGTAAFSTALVYGGWAGLGAAGLIGTGTAGASYLTGVGTTLAYASLGVSAANVVMVGDTNSYINLGLDAFGVGALRYAGAATGLAKTAWMTADIGVNAYQGVAGSVGSYQAFVQGNYVGGVLGAAGGLLGFAGAAYGARGLSRAIALDPTMNPLNYSPIWTSPNSGYLGATGIAGFRFTPNPPAQSGNIIFGELDELGRPSGVRATITGDLLGTGSDAAQRIRPPGFGGQAQGQARGHLLGNQLGGSGRDPRNLVTLFQNPANSPVMRDFENQVATAVKGGQTVNYWAIPVYSGSNLVPIGVTLQAQGSGGYVLSVSIINRGL